MTNVKHYTLHYIVIVIIVLIIITDMEANIKKLHEPGKGKKIPANVNNLLNPFICYLPSFTTFPQFTPLSFCSFNRKKKACAVLRCS